ncbi:MAG TPA: hypothetical protein VG035_10650, partial [Actinomycetota bacterium]|nr:hypothetical protein [Actinomycetota bacterium]
MTKSTMPLLSRADAPHTDRSVRCRMTAPAENRKVGGSIPSLPTRFAQRSGASAKIPPLDEPELATSLRQSPVHL